MLLELKRNWRRKASLKKIHVILNLSSKRASRAMAKTIADLFELAGNQAEIVVSKRGEDIRKLAEAAAAAGAEIIVAAGGDGTISSVAQTLAGTNIALGILPVGTHNNFSKDLGIPQQIELAIDWIVNGKAEKINIGEVNGHYFINNSSIGVYPRIVIQRELKELAGKPRARAFFEATLDALRNLREHRVVMSIAGEKIIRHTPLVFIGNGLYDTNNFGLGKRTIINREKFSVYVLQRTKSRDLIRIAAKNFFKLLAHEEKFEDFSAPELEIETDVQNPSIAVDGEIFHTTSPLKFKLHKKSLNIIRK